MSGGGGKKPCLDEVWITDVALIEQLVLVIFMSSILFGLKSKRSNFNQY
jgi:hypothetical protein